LDLNIKGTKVFDDIYKAYNKMSVDESGKLSKAYRLIVSYGSSRSSKTYSIMQLFSIILLNRKNFKITVWRDTRVNAVATVMEDFKSVILSDIILQQNFVHNKKDATYLCKKTKSIIHFMGTDDVSKVLGMKQDISFFNEISHFTEEVYLQIAQRTSETIFSDYNPSGETILDGFTKRNDTIFLRSTFMDNPFLTDGIRNQLRGYNPYEWGSTYVTKEPPFTLMNSSNDKEVTEMNLPPLNKLNIDNGTSDNWMWLVYGLGIGAEKPNKIYKGWKQCSDEYFDNLNFESYYGLDFGVTAETAVVEVKYDGDRTFYIKEKLYRPASKMGIPLYEYLQVKKIVDTECLLVCDSAKKSMVDDLSNGGLMAVGALKGAGSVARNISQVQSFEIIYTESSTNIHTEQGMYSWKIDKYGVAEDVPDPRQKDHLMNSIEYIISYLVGYLDINYG
jgi:PBSX family phage terminase large subunit